MAEFGISLAILGLIIILVSNMKTPENPELVCGMLLRDLVIITVILELEGHEHTYKRKYYVPCLKPMDDLMYDQLKDYVAERLFENEMEGMPYIEDNEQLGNVSIELQLVDVANITKKRKTVSAHELN